MRQNITKCTVVFIPGNQTNVNQIKWISNKIATMKTKFEIGNILLLNKSHNSTKLEAWIQRWLSSVGTHLIYWTLTSNNDVSCFLIPCHLFRVIVKSTLIHSTFIWFNIGIKSVRLRWSNLRSILVNFSCKGRTFRVRTITVNHKGVVRFTVVRGVVPDVFRGRLVKWKRIERIKFSVWKWIIV